jgi:hypothetical protein
VTDLSIQVTGDAGLLAKVGSNEAAFDVQRLETRTYPNDLGPTAADGHHVATGWVARVPITLVPTNPWDIGGLRYPLNVTAKYHVAGDDRVRTLRARGAIEAQVSRAIYQMGAVSIVFPFFCFGAALVRWRRTR